MKNRTIKLNDNFKIVIKVKETGDNYTQFASIFEGKNKMPLFGTSFKDTDLDNVIINWAKEKIISTSEDLFPNYEILPPKVRGILATFKDETYEECERILSKLKAYGYTFEYYLDALPFNLTKIK